MTHASHDLHLQKAALGPLFLPLRPLARGCPSPLSPPSSPDPILMPQVSFPGLGFLTQLGPEPPMTVSGTLPLAGAQALGRLLAMKQAGRAQDDEVFP